LITVLAILSQIKVFSNFFFKTGTSVDNVFNKFSATGWLVTGICALAVIILLYIIRRQIPIYKKVKGALTGIWQGVTSVKSVKNMPLFIFYSMAIWGSYFLHFYLTFYCFNETSSLGVTCALVCFVVGSIAVIVPTPNGAGPWHFAVKTMLILYGVVDVRALYFVLIVHTLQTLLVILLGIYAWIALVFTQKAELKPITINRMIKQS
jgi:putative membrane protein